MINSYKYSILGIAYIVFYYLIYFIQGEKAYYPISDNIELVSYYKILQNTNSIFSDNNHLINNELLGVPRVCFPSEFYFLTLLSYLFKVGADILEFWMIITMSISIVSYLSMHLFLSYICTKLNLKSNEHLSIIISITSLFFACSPQWTLSGYSVAMQPLITLALLKVLNNEEKFIHWLIVVVFPFLSNLVYSNIFFFEFLFVFYIFFCIYKRKLLFKGLFVFMILIFFTSIVEYRLIMHLYKPMFEHNRLGDNFVSRTNLGIIDFIKETFLMIKQELFRNPTYFVWGYYDPVTRVDNFIIVILYLFMPLLPNFRLSAYNKYFYLCFLLFILLLLASLGNPLFLKILFSKIIPSMERIFYSLSMRYIANISQFIFCLMLFHLLLASFDYLNQIFKNLVMFLVILMNLYQPSHHEFNNLIMNNIIYN